MRFESYHSFVSRMSSTAAGNILSGSFIDRIELAASSLPGSPLSRDCVRVEPAALPESPDGHPEEAGNSVQACPTHRQSAAADRPWKALRSLSAWGSALSQHTPTRVAQSPSSAGVKVESWLLKPPPLLRCA